MARMTRQRKAILDVLDSLDGELVDESGRATPVLFDLLVKEGSDTTMAGLMATLRAMAKVGLIERSIRGRRTFAIRLPGGHERRLAATEGASTLVSEELEPEAAPEPLELDYGQLAVSLLDRVTEILAGGDSETLKVRLGQALAESERLRTKLRDAQEDLRSVAMDRDGLRQQRRTLEANIAQMLKDSHDSGVSRRRVERFMQEQPNMRS
jgi:hypothetical protein